MLPQSAALEFASADNLRGKDETGSERRNNPATVVQHGRGETREIGRNSAEPDSSGEAEDRSLAAPQIMASRFVPTEAEAIAKRVLARAKSPLKDAAAVNSTRWSLYHALQATGLPVSVGTGGQTKWNRHRFRVAKSHTLDAICVGQVNGVVSYPSNVIISKATGRGTYSRTVSDKSGFPRLARPRTKCVQGFQTGDLVRAAVPSGKKMSTHLGRVAVRSSGSFNITTKGKTMQGISHRHCTLLQRGDGWGCEQRKEVGPVARVGLSLPTAKAGGFSSHTHSR